MTLKTPLHQRIDQDAEAIAIDALSFLADRPDELGRFLALSGIGPSSLRQYAADAGFAGGLLDFLLHDEALLLVFAESRGLAPAAIVAARRRLDGDPKG